MQSPLQPSLYLSLCLILIFFFDSVTVAVVVVDADVHEYFSLIFVGTKLGLVRRYSDGWIDVVFYLFVITIFIVIVFRTFQLTRNVVAQLHRSEPLLVH